MMVKELLLTSRADIRASCTSSTEVLVQSIFRLLYMILLPSGAVMVVLVGASNKLVESISATLQIFTDKSSWL